MSHTTSNQATFNCSDLITLFGERACAHLPESLVVKGVSTDSRTVSQGNIFVALRGERFDAHTLVKEALDKGAALAIVEDRIKTGIADLSAPLVLVPSTLHALGALAHLHRKRFLCPVIAVAGSAGKTTTKDMTARLLSEKFHVLKTEGNFNNQVGVPLTLLRLSAEHTVAVIEIGTNEPGEIEILSAMVAPTHGIITNVGKEHLEKLIDEDGVEREETALFRYLAEHGGMAFINMNDQRLRKYRRSGWVHYGLEEPEVPMDISATFRLQPSTHAVLQIQNNLSAQSMESTVIRANLQSVGATGARNALAAAAVGVGLGMNSDEIQRGLEGFRPAASEAGYGRMVAETLVLPENRTITLLNDCYNANPTSMYAALETLQTTQNARKIALLGDMRELGASSATEHDALLAALRKALWLDFVILTGTEMLQAHTRFVMEHSESSKIVYSQSTVEAAEILASRLKSGDVLLVKGSRGVRLEEAVARLLGQ
ncbi:MAG: UDP-N-acetylmuramoyl-tripeptide--D-alanyl-D-alanine ligase [Candidatus Kapabacteria bacterium]|jgi:UDP-N-acetylmuramoyl-tripeptide--D-alanyl-D-alanine ligase|nr:UDP-N-acetylmuramoyl-tripeptide--D-alanyl-D-alanine ligase [Candidatus Kapabacteria bacterium]